MHLYQPTRILMSILIVLLMFMLTGCGGGDDESSTIPMPEREPRPDPEPEPDPEAARLPFPLEGWSESWYDAERNITWYPAAFETQHYGITEVQAQSAAGAQHMPIYHDDSCEPEIGVCPDVLITAPLRRLFVGIDQGTTHIGELSYVGNRGDIDIRHGGLNDGAGREIVVSYLEDSLSPGQPVRRYDSGPEVRLIGSASANDAKKVAAAVQLINAALPASAKISIGDAMPDFSLLDTVDADGRWFVSGEELGNTIHVEFIPRAQFHSNAAATTWNNLGGSENVHQNSYIQFSRGTNAYANDRQGVILLAHELLHALGIDGHVSPDFDSIMEDGDGIYSTGQNSPQPVSLLYPVDREALRALYDALAPGDSPANLGAWASTFTHLHGNGEHAAFGVALRNGYAEPWAHGYLPETDLANNPTPTGAATWSGTLLGFTPGAEAVVGDARLGVNLGAMTGQADFTSLESWTAGEAPGNPGTGTQWGDGDLVYSIAVTGNTFKQTGGDDGILTGAFFGESHEGMGGVLERDDLTAAFGGKR